MLDYVLKLLTECEHMEDAGSFYDEARIIQFMAVTPRSETVLYRLRRRQDHAHSKPWDYRIAVITDGVVVQTIAVPN